MITLLSSLSHSRVGRSGLWRVSLMVLLSTLAAFVLATEALVLVPGSSRVLSFNNMRRVVVVEPNVADVVVASRGELVVFGKALGNTKVYIWDARGRHEYAVTVRSPLTATALVRRVRDLVADYVNVSALGEMIVLSGTCPGEPQRDKALEIARQIAGPEMTVLDLLTLEGQDLTPAEATARQMQKLYGPSYEYVVCGTSTIVVRGNVSPQMQLELKGLEEALGNEVRIASITTAGPSSAAPVDEIQAAVGPHYSVWMLSDSTVVVEGEAPTTEDAERANKLLEAYSGRAQIINLVRVAPEPKPSLDEYLAMVREAVGDTYTVRSIGPASVAVEGTVGDEEEARRLADIVDALPPAYKVLNLVRVVAPEKRRIIVHVKVVDVNRDKLKRYGVDWGQIIDGTFVDQPWLIKAEGGFDNYYTLGADLHALEEQNYAKVLAEPNLVVNDGEEASILVGGEIPIPVSQPGSEGFNAITIEYKKYGVDLRVTPTVTEAGQIVTKVEPEVSAIDYGSGVTVAGLRIPALKTRRSSTTVTVSPSSTLVIGGLLRQDESKLLRKVPVLGDIPIIGEFFKRQEITETKTELVIFLSPEILPPVGEGGTK